MDVDFNRFDGEVQVGPRFDTEWDPENEERKRILQGEASPVAANVQKTIDADPTVQLKIESAARKNWL